VLGHTECDNSAARESQLEICAVAAVLRALLRGERTERIRDVNIEIKHQP
jgi:hypothetical protein